MRENFTILKQLAALEHPTFPANPLLFRVTEPRLAAILGCRTIHGMLWVLQETYLDDLLEKDESLLSLQRFKEFGILLSEIGTWYWRKCQEAGEGNETRTATFVNTWTTLPKRGWSVWSYWWNLFSQRKIDHLRFPIPELHLGKFSWLYGISSKLESQLQNWSMFKDSRSSSYNALDQRSWDSKINWRTYDIAIDCGTNRFFGVSCAWCDDCACIEEASRQACSLPQKSKCRRAACSKLRPILTRKTNCLHDLRIFSSHRSFWSCTRTLRLVQYTFAEWPCPRFQSSRRSSSIISKRYAFRCDPGRIAQVKITGLCAASDCFGFVWPRNCSK